MTRRDITDAALDISIGVIGVVALAGAIFVMCGCATPRPRTVVDLPAQTEIEQRVATAGIEAWRAAGLKTTPAVSWLEQLRIERPATVAAYDERCPAAVLGHSWACLRWRGWDVPVAVLSPLLLTETQRLRAALHELCHAMGYRFGRWADYDSPWHTDPIVWAGKSGSRPDSVEQRAQRALADMSP